MENASNALIIAGSVLIGVMILSVGIYLISSLGSTSRQINIKLQESEVTEFNSQFIKYDGKEDIRAHDIVSIANLAKKNNKSRFGEELPQTSEYYITVKVNNATPGGDYGTLSKFQESSEKQQMNFIKNNDIKINTTDAGEEEAEPIYFKCMGYVINDQTKLVKQITFELK